eukprot:7014808-Karenia_brevis.AAC.1
MKMNLFPVTCALPCQNAAAWCAFLHMPGHWANGHRRRGGLCSVHQMHTICRRRMPCKCPCLGTVPRTE